MKLVYGVFAVTIVVIAVLFALSNRHTVPLALWPLPFTITAIPVYALALGMFVIGFFTGGLFAWLRSLRTRTRAVARHAKPLEREVDELRHRLDAIEPESAAGPASNEGAKSRAVAAIR